MAILTDAGIKAAIKEGRQRRIAEGKGRGSGRLVLVIKPKAGGVSAEWYAQQWKEGKRTTAKLGAYPAMSLAAARDRFSADYADPISTGTPLARAKAVKAGTIEDLIGGYCDSLDQRGASSAEDIRQRLGKFAEFVGKEKQARDITPVDVVEYLRPIFKRGAPSLADHDRSYIRAAFGWGLRAEHDYRATTVGRRFGLVANPAADIPTAPKRAGNRWLEEDEYLHLYRWLGAPANQLTASYTVALRVVMLTGQRVQEIAGLRRSQWISGERLLEWTKTKNGRPHLLPVCTEAARLMDGMPEDGEWLFPMISDPSRSVNHGTLYCALWRNRESIGLPAFTNRDLRRTWKTLAARAGLTKWERDLLQNHARSDVSSVHYDRHDYLEEKRAAVAKWETWVTALLAKPRAQKSPA